MPSKTIQLTNNGPATTTLSFFQLPNDDPAHYEQLYVPTTTPSTGLQASNNHHSSLNDVTAPQAFSTMSATKTVTMTKVPAVTTAITKVPQIQFNKNKLTRTQQKKSTTSILHPVKMMANNATSPSLLLFDVKDVSATMAATHANSTLQLIVASIQ
jgi:hypothetical protein